MPELAAGSGNFEEHPACARAAAHRAALLLVTASPRWVVSVLLFVMCASVHGKDLTLTISESATSPAAGSGTSFWLNALNTSTQEVSWLPPNELKCRLISNQTTIELAAALSGTPGTVMIAPGGFIRREYAFDLPAQFIGETLVEVADVGPVRLVLNVHPAPRLKTDGSPLKDVSYFLKGRHLAATAAEYDPDSFFKEHIFGHEPLYFIAGTKSPNAKFQISFKYRLFNDHGWVADKAPFLTGTHLAYSQTSLWDWNGSSAPFFDSSYRPELLYFRKRLIGGRATNWFGLDFQAGFLHESNGRDESDSRSLNIAYVRPRLVFGKDTGPQLTLMPRAWVYVGDVDDNPDIADYRGYADLRAVFGWKRGLQISALGRIGQHLSHGSAMIDATYPLMQPPYGSFSIYLHVQYFTGYGESLIGYKDRSEVLRAGISLYR
jgi:phospholipase A1